MVCFLHFDIITYNHSMRKVLIGLDRLLKRRLTNIFFKKSLNKLNEITNVDKGIQFKTEAKMFKKL
ncbi:hypothetical protein ASG65_05120 [Bacillus sp. Leaf13]|nr:hypothetical protein ASG65_05120 [Bacillus sp. Leaf13]